LIDYVEKNYSDIIIPLKGEGFMDDFFKENSKNFSIYSNKDFYLKSGLWIPIGLLFKYYPDEDTVDLDQLAMVNNMVFGRFHDYQTGPRSVKASLFLKEVGSNYAVGCARVGRYFFDQKKFWIAKEYFEKGLEFDSEYQGNYFLLGMTQFNLKNCKDAEKNYLEYLSREKEDRNIYIALSALYRHCIKDEEKAKYYDDIYEQTVRKGLKKLEEL
jgi:tetratricopeptide (TPR) repeat protein